ncbi:MAG TPA: DUF6364 family protein [Bacteroidales bacterium]|nr:DUF6364 family protein [Bacteroidales bacterium]HPS18435.1 DUF6364 family protein [Bacteroidales bacterium]
MNSKLTLKLDQDTIELAKDYARDKNTSLSKMIENYLRLLVRRNRQDIKISPLVESLSGVIKSKHTDMEKQYIDHLTNKYK